MSKENGNTSFWDDLLEYIVFHYRWIFILLFLMPVNVVYEQYSRARNALVFWLNSAPKAHDSKVADVQRQIRHWNDDGRKTKMCTGRPGWMTISFRQPKYKKTMTNINTNKLVDILEIDTVSMTVRVEPMVSMGQITAALNCRGLTLPIVPELDDLTVGGMINGCGVESSSFKAGLFQHICLEFELVMADGSLIKASRTENSDLFFAVPWSHGTLGFLVAATLKIVVCEPYIQVTYTPYRDQQCLADALKTAALDSEHDFVEAIAFDRTCGVLMTGRFASEPDDHEMINKIGCFYKPWFFKHVESYLFDDSKATTEFIPLRDYYHRHSRSIFWELQDIVPFGNNPIFRYLLGWTMPPKISLLKLTTPAALKRLYDRHHVIQDMLVPLSSLQQSLAVFHQEVKVYPIWLCPFKLPHDPGMLKNHSDEIYVDVGVYGTANRKQYKAVETTRRIEDFVRSAKGYQMLYADTYMSSNEFWSMFDRELYDSMRQRYNCVDAFPNVYEKVCRAARD